MQSEMFFGTAAATEKSMATSHSPISVPTSSFIAVGIARIQGHGNFMALLFGELRHELSHCAVTDECDFHNCFTIPT